MENLTTLDPQLLRTPFPEAQPPSDSVFPRQRPKPQLKRGNNKFGSKGKPRCASCRKWKRNCIYDETDRICTHCRSKGWTHCEILEPSKYWGSRALTESAVFNDIAEGLNLAHQRFEWIRIMPSSATTLDDMLEIVNQQSPGQEDDTNQDEIRSLAEHANAIVSMDTVEGINAAHQGLGWVEGGSADPLAILEQMLLDPALASSSNHEEDDSTDVMDLKKFVEHAVSIVCNQFSDVDIEYIRSLVQEEVLERRAEIFAIEEAELRFAREHNAIPRFSSLDPSTYTPDSLQRSETVPDVHSTTTNSAVVDLQSMEWATSVVTFEDIGSNSPGSRFGATFWGT